MAVQGSTYTEPPDKSKNHCPKCGSTDFRRDIEGDIINVITAIMPGPPSPVGINYVCKSCGNRYTRWQDIIPK